MTKDIDLDKNITVVLKSNDNNANNNLFADTNAVAIYYLHDKLSLDEYLELNKNDITKKSYKILEVSKITVDKLPAYKIIIRNTENITIFQIICLKNITLSQKAAYHIILCTTSMTDNIVQLFEEIVNSFTF